MKKNLNNIAIIITLALAYNLQPLNVSCNSNNQGDNIEQHENEEKAIKADSEIEDLLINSILPEPSFENPALWKVLIREYGIKLAYTYFSIKTWFAQTYYNIKESICISSAKHERN